MATPFVVMSFNRPQFLEPVLASLTKQRFVDLGQHEAHLFQDGAVNRYSRIRYARDEDIDACVALFQQYFPAGVVHRSPDNIGVCENFIRAENFIFEQRGFDCAWFFEDDMVLSPAYFVMMQALESFARARDNVGYFAAYGDYYLKTREVYERRRELITLDHHWAFGLTRKHWLDMQPLLKPFYDIVVGNDYSRRDHRAVLALYRDVEASPTASSQDAAKAMASDALGVWRCNTLAPFARYIGTTGLHMTPEQFAELGFANADPLTDPVEPLRYPGAEAVKAAIAAQHGVYTEIRRQNYDEFVTSLPMRKFNPMRAISREEVEWLLSVGSIDEAAAATLAPNPTSPAFPYVSAVVASLAWALRKGQPLGRPCDERDVRLAYALCLHREADAASIFERHVGNTDVRSFVEGLLDSGDCRGLWGKIELPPASKV